MKKEINFYVIGGQYADYCYGGAPTLIGAKRLATKNEEYRGFYGWVKPHVYRAEDCEVCNNFYGEQISPKEYAEPVA